MIKVYCYSRCGTCKKALKWLDENNIEHEDIDIKTSHPDKDTLQKYYVQSGLPLKRFFKTSGIPYRELGLSKKLPNMSDEEQLKLLATDGMLVTRALVVGNDFVLVGFKVEEWEAKLKQ
jgi:arsenate reductase